MAGTACGQHRCDDRSAARRCRTSAPTLRSDGTTWTLDKLEFRAPGFTQVKVDGRLYPLGKGLGFAGGASVDSNDPKNLVAWLAGRATATAQFKPWRARGDVTLRPDRIAVERLRTEIDRGVIEGSIAYVWPAGDRPARLDGELRAAELDLDGVLGFGESALSGLGLERPGEVALAMEIGRARIAGFDARNIAARLKLDAARPCDRASVGRRSRRHQFRRHAAGSRPRRSPGGSITVDLDARDLNGVLALAERFAPALADPLRRVAARQKTATLQANVSMESSGDRRRQRQDRPDRQRRRGPRQCLGDRDRQARGLHADRPRRAGRRRCPDRWPARGRWLGAAARIDRPRPHGRGRAEDRRGSIYRRTDRSAASFAFEGKLIAGPIDAGGKGTLRFASDQPAMLDFDRSLPA